MSIPKLELTAAVLAVRLDIMLLKELDFDSCVSTFWCDSTAVLQIIRNSTKRFLVFIANRLSVIETHSSPENWRHYPSRLNPADLASRGCSAKTLLKSHYWFSGPEFLWKTEEHWPHGPIPLSPLPLCDVRPPNRTTVFLLTSKRSPDIIDRLISQHLFFRKLKKTVAWILRLKSCLLVKVRTKSNPLQFDTPDLTVQELHRAENKPVKFIQRKHFSKLFVLPSANEKEV